MKFKNRVLSAFIILSVLAIPGYATSYYVNSSTGSNSNTGTSSSTPWLDFTNINSHTFVAGDNIYLACGSSWNQEMDLHGSGSSTSVITLTSYGSGAKPKISRNSLLTDRTIQMESNPSYWNISNLEICNANEGLDIGYTTFGNNGLKISNLYIHDIDLDINGIPSGTGSVYYSTGINIYGGSTLPNSSQYVCSGIEISDCEIAFTTAPWDFGQIVSNNQVPYSFQNVFVHDNYIHDARGPTAMRDMTNGHLVSNHFANIATTKRAGGNTAIYTGNSEGLCYFNNFIDGVPNVGANDQTAIDFEAFNNNAKVCGNFIGDTAGSGIEILFINDSIFENGLSDYNTNLTITGNTFTDNATTWHYVFWAVGGRTGDTYNQTGTISENITYLEPTGNTFAGGTGSFSGFTQTNNVAIPSTNNVYNASDGYSGTQGANQWTYVYWNGSTNTNLTYDSTNSYWGSASGYISEFNTLPTSGINNWMMRVWTAPTSGTISIRGRVLMDTTGGAGVHAQIKKNTSIIWGSQTISGSDQLGYDTNLDSITVATGDVIVFMVNCSNNTNSVVSWLPTIAYYP
jgi:hypothetical protein